MRYELNGCVVAIHINILERIAGIILLTFFKEPLGGRDSDSII